MSIRSELFRRPWAIGEVREKRVATVRIMHSVAGRLDFDYDVLAVPARPDRALMVYLPEPGSATAESLGLLLSWSD